MKIDQANRLMFTGVIASILAIYAFSVWKINKAPKALKDTVTASTAKADTTTKKQALLEYSAKYKLIKERKQEFLNIMRFAAQPPSFFESSSFLKDNSLDEIFNQSVSTLCAIGAVLDTVPGAGELDLAAFMERIDSGKITDMEYGYPVHELMLAGTNAETERIIQIYSPKFKAKYVASIITGRGTKKTFELID